MIAWESYGAGQLFMKLLCMALRLEVISTESYGNRWRLHPGVMHALVRAKQEVGIATMCRRIGVHPVALELAASTGIARAETVAALTAWEATHGEVILTEWEAAHVA